MLIASAVSEAAPGLIKQFTRAVAVGESVLKLHFHTLAQFYRIKNVIK